MKIFFFLFLLTISLKSYTQSIFDTSVITKTERGILFLSEYNFRYDTTRSGDLILIPTFSDFFFPTNDCNKKIFKKNHFTFNSGVQLYYLQDRDKLKKHAKLIFLKDSNSCYPFKSFYIMPVTVTYNITHYNDFEACRQSFFDVLLENRRKVVFNLLLKTIRLLDIHELNIPPGSLKN